MSSLRGALLINKPKGFTSHDVVGKVRKIFKTKEVGHTGTLDPMAEGLLILLLGEATKISNYILSEDKSYIADLDLGYTTDTLDLEGQVLSKSESFDISKEQMLEAAKKLTGDLQLEVPIYSAVKINGKKLYDYARQGQQIQTPVRVMRFHKAEVLKTEIQSMTVKLSCEKGAYIRAWVDQLGKDLQVGATMTGLVRQTIGAFSLDDSVDLKTLSELSDKAEFSGFIKDIEKKSFFIPLEKCLKGAFFRLDTFDTRLMKNGQIPNSLNKRLTPVINQCLKQQKDQILRVFSSEQGKDKLVALIEVAIKNPKPKILRVFN